jgi:protein-S-isoprenylcysteine O-methyltransferase Ste14
MDWLELKIPPVLVLVVFMLLNWILSLPIEPIEFSSFVKVVMTTFFVAGGIMICLAGGNAFRKAKTTVNPMTPDASTALVVSGIYRYTRNPMYLGFLSVLIGWSIYLASPLSIVGVAGFIVYISLFQIKPEERILKGRFTTDYQHYSSKVRRWL